METKLIVPIAARNLEDARAQIKAAAAAGAEMVELRVDYLKKLDRALVEGLIGETRKAAGQAAAIVVTCRDKQQGGVINYQEQLRIEVLAGALRAGADFVDLEYENFLSPANQERILLALSEKPKARLVLSAHNFERRFDDIGRLYSGILAAYEKAVPKLVYTANHINDCFEAFDLLHNTSGERIAFCMGEAGLISRVLAKKLGCLYTFASVDDKTATAPGQLTIEEFKKLYRFACIDADTEVYGVIGSPIGHSLSPAIHNVSFAEAGLNKVYLPLLVEGGKVEFSLFMDNILARDWLGFRGLSITIPHKQNALDYVREAGGSVEPLAARIGAVNTVLMGTDGNLSAYNTDYAGALDAITSTLGVAKTGLKGRAVAVVGAGGVARAIVAGLSDAGAKITIYNRTVERGERLAGEFGCPFHPLGDVGKLDAELLINCTSIGMQPNVDATAVPKEYIKKDMVVFDTVYNPVETLLLREAREAGAKTIDGLSMFVNQACAQFRLFTGQDAHIETVRKTISNYLCPD
jgi:3-dehydroquinate dehydratase/shikimate dehydrogenase